MFLSYNAYSQYFDLLLKKILINDESINSSKFYVKKSTNDLSSVTSVFTPKIDLSVPVGKEILINNDRSELQRMCSSIISKVGKNNLSDSFLEKYNAQNSNKINNKAIKFGVNLSKLLISDLNISNAELDIRKLLFNEAYQLK